VLYKGFIHRYASKVTAFSVNYKLIVVFVCTFSSVFQQEYGSLLGSERAASSGLFSGQTPQPTGTKTPMPSEGDVGMSCVFVFMVHRVSVLEGPAPISKTPD